MRRIVIFSLLVLLLVSAPALSEIKIGCLFDLTGKAMQIGQPTKNVAEMVRDEINKNGGVNGEKIRLVIVDTESEPSKAVAGLKRLVEKDRVHAVVGPTTTGAAMACLETIEKAEIPMIACAGGDGPVTPTRKWVFKSPQRTTTAVGKIYGFMKSKGIKNVAIFTASDKFGQEGKAALKKLAKTYGIKIVAEEELDPLDADMTMQISKIAAREPQAMIVWTIGPAGAVIAKNHKALKARFPLFQCHGQPDPSYIKLAGKAAEGTMMPSTKLMVADQLPDSDPQKPVIKKFIAEYTKRKYGDISTHSGYAWDAIQLIARAMQKVGTDPAKVREAIENTRNYVGVSGIYNMSKDDHCGLGTNSLVMVRVENGKFRLIK